MIDDEIHRYERFDHAGVLIQTHDSRTHRGQINQQGHAGKILKQHARYDERDFLGTFTVGLPVGDAAHIVFIDLLAVKVAQDRFQNDPDTDGQSRDWPDAFLLELWQRKQLSGFACGWGERLERVEKIMWHSRSKPAPKAEHA